MKICLVYPDYKENLTDLQEPLGLLYLGAVLRKGNHKVSLIDMVLSSFEELDKITLENDLFIFSVSSVLFKRSVEILKRIKKTNPKAICIIGGPYSTVDPERCLRMGFDYAFYSEGEKTIMDFVDALSEKHFENVKGLVYKKGETIIKNSPPEFIDIDSIPFPARDLWNYEPYFKKGRAEIGMIVTRGCPYNCLFCQPMLRNLFGSKTRIRSPKNVVDEIEQVSTDYGHLFKNKVKIWFKDSTFTYAGIEWLKEFRDLLRERKLEIDWGCASRVDLINEEILTVMKEAGVNQISFGVESGSQKILNFYRKGVKVEQIIKVFDLCHKVGVNTFAYFMIGAPIETKDDLALTLKLIKRIKPDGLQVLVITPYIGNDFYNYVMDNDLTVMEEASLSYDMKIRGAKDKFMIKTKYLTNDDLRKFRKKIYRYNTTKLLLKYLSSWENVKKLGSYIIKRPTFVKNYLKKSL